MRVCVNICTHVRMYAPHLALTSSPTSPHKQKEQDPPHVQSLPRILTRAHLTPPPPTSMLFISHLTTDRDCSRLHTHWHAHTHIDTLSPDAEMACQAIPAQVCCGVRCSVFGQCMTHIWCVRCLLITKSPHAPCHFRYLIWVICYTRYVGLNGVQFGDYLCCCVYCNCECFEVRVFNTFWSRSCMQLSISVLLFEGHRGLLSWICTYTHIHMHAYTNAESCHMHMICCAYERVMSCMDYMSHTYDTPHIRISHVTHSKGWCNQWACVCIWMSHVNIYNMSHISMRHIKYIWRVTHMN